jgi:multisubunit Na+/H+ antiporter MnhG subunit
MIIKVILIILCVYALVFLLARAAYKAGYRHAERKHKDITGN